METVWRYRIMLSIAIFIIIYGDFFGYENATIDKTSKIRQSEPPLRDNQHEIVLEDDIRSSAIQSPKIITRHNHQQIKSKSRTNSSPSTLQFSDEIRQSCLPKLLCEMASKAEEKLGDRERGLLNLIRSTTLSLTWSSAPTRWHFAAHMGQLLRDTVDSLSGSIGCSYLWPQCPYSSQKLLQLTFRVKLL